MASSSSIRRVGSGGVARGCTPGSTASSAPCRAGSRAPCAARSKSSREAVAERLRAAGARRLGGLLAAARGANRLAVGTDAVEDSLARGKACFVLVARDSRSGANSHRIAEALSSDRALVVLDKAELGRRVGRNEAGVVAALEPGLGAALRLAAELSSYGEVRTLPAGRDAVTKEAS